MTELAIDDARHGTQNGYGNLGCRCDACRAANTAYMREHKLGGYAVRQCPGCGNEMRAISELCRTCYDATREPDHGTETRYTQRHCRCEECRKAANKARQRRRETPNVGRHGTHSGYSNGCRCDECRMAHNEYVRDSKRAKRVVAA